MGWSWSLYLCQKFVEHLVASQHPLGLGGALRGRSPAPELAPGVCAEGVYVDNFNSFSVSAEDSHLSVERFCSTLQDQNI
eukprot:1595155-Pyramimonas_sp.AAC.1